MKIRPMILMILLSLLTGAAGVSLGASPPPPLGSTDPQEAVKQEIWAKEQAIYAGRARGDMSAYMANTSTHYVSWPPQYHKPLSYIELAASARDPKPSREQLTMVLADFAMSGDTAVIYYWTHMSMKSDGTPVDLSYEVTHTWVREQGAWRILGGMARPTPAR